MFVIGIALFTDADADDLNETGVSSETSRVVNGDGESVVALFPSLDVAMVVESKVEMRRQIADKMEMGDGAIIGTKRGETRDGSHEFETTTI